MSLTGSTTSTAPAISTSAQPAAVARAPAPSTSTEPGSRAESVKFLAERRQLRLAASDGDTVSNDAESGDPSIDPAVEQQADSEETPEQEEPPETGKEPTWAQKLREDLSAKTERLKDVETKQTQREGQWGEAVQKATWAREDVADEAAFATSYAQALEQVIEQAADRMRRAGLLGADMPLLDPLSKRLFFKGREEAQLKRQLERAQSHTKNQHTERAGVEAQGKLQALRKQLPELDWEKVPEARAWLAARFAKDGLGMRGIDQDAVAFAKALRWDRSQRNAPARSTGAPRPSENARPSSSTMTGTSSGGGEKRTPAVPETAKESLKWLAARKAARK